MLAALTPLLNDNRGYARRGTAVTEQVQHGMHGNDAASRC
jgi:hypothetical protein